MDLLDSLDLSLLGHEHSPDQDYLDHQDLSQEDNRHVCFSPEQREMTSKNGAKDEDNIQHHTTTTHAPTNNLRKSLRHDDLELSCLARQVSIHETPAAVLS
jgi:hypothetical protein